MKSSGTISSVKFLTDLRDYILSRTGSENFDSLGTFIIVLPVAENQKYKMFYFYQMVEDHYRRKKYRDTMIYLIAGRLNLLTQN